MGITLEQRQYGEDSTPDEIAAIRERLSVYRPPDLFMYLEMPAPSPFACRIFKEQFDQLTADLPHYDVILDLTVAKAPDAATRVALKKLFGSLDKMRRVTVFTERNFMLNVAARFVLGSTGLRDFTVHKTLDEALKAIGR
jgi:hypothetical protein